jgi:predicted RNA-binding protein with PIN domain
MLQLSLRGYAPCHNTEAVAQAIGYDPLSDLDNPPGSVFCAHGAGFHVPWDQVHSYMHLESCLKQERPALITRNLQPEDKALEAIMEREFGPIKRPVYSQPQHRSSPATLTIRPPRQQYLVVDGYNIIFAWDELAQTAREDLDAARRGLLNVLSSYAGYKKHRLVVVFDGYKRKGNTGEKEQHDTLSVVYTAEGETADAYIEGLAEQIGKNYNVKVATSDGLVQLSSLRSGVLRMPASELRLEVEAAHAEMKQHYSK